MQSNLSLLTLKIDKGMFPDNGQNTYFYLDNVIAQSDVLQIKEENNYYPFGLKHKGYNNVVNGTNYPYGYNGKEENDELGLEWLDFGARNYDASLGRWMNIDPHSESYYTLSPYNSFANNPISFVDPDGRDLLFWQKSKKGDKWEQVEFDQLSQETQDALIAFAKTEEGFNFLSDFANEGDKIGDIEFTETGKYAKHELSYGEFNDYGYESASSKAVNKKGDGKLTFEWTLNTAYKGDNISDGINPVARMSITNGHEAFIHFEQYLDELIKAFDSGDMNRVNEILRERKAIGKDGGGRTLHNAYLDGSSNTQRMRTYLSQLINILNPQEVRKALKSHDDNLKR